MPLLTRMIGAPLSVDIGPGAVAHLAPLLADRRISSGGHVAVVVGPGLGEEIADTLRPGLENADFVTLGEEEMKVHVAGGRMTRINKALDPATAQGEYIGLTLIEPEAADALADALRATFERDPQLYYEDGFQEYANRGGHVGVASVGGIEWVEVDDQRDLARAQEVACRC